jgi:predicted NBD/HSP70 family sugar kinase
LTDLFYEKLGYRVFIDNNTRAMLYGEYMSNNTSNAKNIIFVNISWGLAISIMINGQLYYGESGFAGEFGHMSVFDNEELCHCGKKGCLETETSGSAIHRIFMKRVLNGENSILSAPIKEGQEIELSDIIDAVNKEDILAIDIIEEVGNKLGKYIAGLINIFNPGLVIIGGELSQTGDYISLPIISAINKYSLNLANKDSVITLSKLKDKAGVIGACMLARNNYLKLSQIGGYKY